MPAIKTNIITDVNNTEHLYSPKFEQVPTPKLKDGDYFIKPSSNYKLKNDESFLINYNRDIKYR